MLHMGYLYKLTAVGARFKLNQISQPNLANPAHKRPGWGGVEAEGILYSNFSKSLYVWSGAVTLITLLE